MTKNFKETEVKKNNGVQMYLKCFEYKKIVSAIDTNDVAELAKLNLSLNKMNFSFKDVPFWRTDSCFLEGKPYVPPLEYAMQKRSFSAFRFILENCLDAKRVLQSAGGLKLLTKSALPNRVRSARTAMKSIDVNLALLREKAEEEEIEEIIDILDNFGEDKEISKATNIEILSASSYTEKSVFLKNINLKKVNIKSYLPMLTTLNSVDPSSNNFKKSENKFASKSMNNLSLNQNNNSRTTSQMKSDQSSKLCFIL